MTTTTAGPDTTPKLDWHPPSEHRRDANQPFRVGTQLAKVDINVADFNLELAVRNRSWKRLRWLDQGQQGACTGFGAGHCLSSGYRPWIIEDQHAFGFYRGAQKHDYWAGEDYEGSSVQGAAEFLRSIKALKAYWWIETPDELMAAVTRFGPIEIGTWWYSGMWRPDSSGLIVPKGTRDGGHAYAVSAIDLKTRRARIDNSWGPRWGVNGSAYIDLDALFDLIFGERGEAVLFRKNKYSTAALDLALAA